MTAGVLTVLIIGGYGTFGGRLARLLAGDVRLRLIIAGRSRRKAGEFSETLTGPAEVVAAAFDRNGDVDGQMRALAPNLPDIVVDATGPFQTYGPNPYRVVEAALARGADYIDLADGSGFVAGIAAFDARARKAGRFVLSGASTCPVLTCAAIRRLSRDMDGIDSVTAGIAPSPHAGVGRNVIRAIAGYAGKPVDLVRDGKPAVAHALTESRRFTIAAPGRIPMRPIRFSLVDVPDLRIVPGLWPSVRSVWVGAGPVPETLHRVLNMLAWLVRLRLLPSLSPLASAMDFTTRLARWDERRSGMFVAVTGTDRRGAAVARSWHLQAEGDDGPLIPSMVAEAIIRRCLDGRRPEPGARAAAAELELEDFAPLFARHAIFTGQRAGDADDAAQPLYRRLLGEAFDRLAPPIRDMHALDGEKHAEGRAVVERGTGWLSRLAAWLVGFPPAAGDVPVTVDFRLVDGREHWRRNFAGHIFSSTQEAGRGRYERLMVERFGWMAFGLAVTETDGKLGLVMRRWDILGLPMPAFLAPVGKVQESVGNGHFRFHVEISLPVIGLVVRYRGWLLPKSV